MQQQDSNMSWCCGHCTKTLRGLSAADGTMQAAVLFSDRAAVNFPNISAASACTRGWTDVPLGDDSGEASPKVSGLSDPRLECICWLEYNNTHPVLNHVVPPCCTRQRSAAGALKTPHVQVKWDTVAVFVPFFILPVCCTDGGCKNQTPYFFPS